MPLPKTPALTADCVVFDNEARVLLVRRARPPFTGHYALPGGFVEVGETVEQACRRELMEETGVKAGRLKLVGVYSDPKRDPRGHTCSVAFVTRVANAAARAGDDAESVHWVSSRSRVKLAFDHAKILAAAGARYRSFRCRSTSDFKALKVGKCCTSSGARSKLVRSRVGVKSNHHRKRAADPHER
jgi:8-oxo-dGTP diphosphatase